MTFVRRSRRRSRRCCRWGWCRVSIMLLAWRGTRRRFRCRRSRRRLGRRGRMPFMLTKHSSATKQGEYQPKSKTYFFHLYFEGARLSAPSTSLAR